MDHFLFILHFFVIFMLFSPSILSIFKNTFSFIIFSFKDCSSFRLSYSIDNLIYHEVFDIHYFHFKALRFHLNAFVM